MKNNRFWLLIFVCILAAGISGTIWLGQKPPGSTIEVLQNGQVLYRLNLADYMERTEIKIEYEDGENILLLENGRVCIVYADCPDQTCVKMGWLDSAAPIVCLPHRLVIRYTNDGGGLDTVTK